ncbi:MAG: hypothetical protein NT074_03655 [Methanomicrobiales archaeon]|nr:hypothetical protein [Methanomicrobiales archaeon]
MLSLFATEAEQAPGGMDAEFRAMKDKINILQKYPGASDEQLLVYQDLEDRKAREKIEIPLRLEREKADRERVIREQAAATIAAVVSGKLRIRLNGARIEALPADLKLGCPSCGAYCPEVYSTLCHAGETCRESPKFTDVIGRHGFPGTWYAGCACPACGESVAIEAQYCFID